MCIYRPNVQPLFPWSRGAPTECITACGAASGGGKPGDVTCEYKGDDAELWGQSCDESIKPEPRVCPKPPPCGTLNHCYDVIGPYGSSAAVNIVLW